MSETGIVAQQLVITKKINDKGVMGFTLQGTHPFVFLEDIGLLTAAMCELFRIHNATLDK